MRFLNQSKITLMLSLLALLIALPAAAEYVSPAQAVQAASVWISGRYNQDVTTTSLVKGFRAGVFYDCPPDQAKAEPAAPLIYLVSFGNDGFALVSADDNSVPILAYSAQKTQNLQSFSPAFTQWVQIYADQIEELIQSKTVLTENRSQWQELLSGTWNPLGRQDRSIAPLVATNWDQGWPYNELCPVDVAGPGSRVYAGCVATAMGMVMKYWNHPATGVGNNSYYAYGYGYQNANFGATTYHWDQMPNSVGSSNLAIATLLYHCGVAVEMNYAPDGSGAQSSDAAWAMSHNFRYPNAAIHDRSSYSDTQWNALLQAQLNNGSPMYYSGSGEGGHAFVVDGYDPPNYYHFNFGWSGGYNGFYYMNSINPGGNTFNNWNSAIINSVPENYSIANAQIKLETVGGETVGNNFTISVTSNPILGSWNVNHYEFNLLYDHTFIDFVGFSTANTISAQGDLTVTETEPGTLLVSWNGSSSLLGSGTLAAFTFLPVEAGEFLFDLVAMKFNSSPVANTQYLMVDVVSPVATLAQSQISMSNVMHLGYLQTGTTDLRTSYLLPSWNVTTYQFDLGFDPAKLEYVGFETSGTLSENLEPIVVLNPSGNATVTCEATSGLTGSGILLKLVFRAIGNGPGASVTTVAPANFYFNTTEITALGSANFILSAGSAADDEIAAISSTLQVYPNPVYGQARILLTGKADQPIELKVFNLKGQLLETISGKAGTELTWDPKDKSGNRLATGIYLLTWDQGKSKGSKKLLIVH